MRMLDVRRKDWVVSMINRVKRERESVSLEGGVIQSDDMARSCDVIEEARCICNENSNCAAL